MRQLLIASLVAACLSGCGQSERCPSGAACDRVPGPLGDTRLTGVPPADGGFRSGMTDPSPRYQAAIAYDPAHAQYILFGGQTVGGASDETWIYYGYRHVPPAGCQYNACDPWGRVTPAHKPAARSGAAMAYDPAHQVVVMYGGLLAGKPPRAASDTWTWNGTDWTLVDASAGPGARNGASMVTAGGRVLLFGGEVAPDSQADLWAWDGTRWSRIDHDPSPPGRQDAAVAWNPIDASLYVFGGTEAWPASRPGPHGLPRADLWRFKDGAWRELYAAGPHVTLAYAIWDQGKSRLVVVNGIGCPTLNLDTWVWDGKWMTDGGGGSRWGAAVAQDADGNSIEFGGSNKEGC